MKHPSQPIQNKNGILRFKENAIVRHLLEHGRKHGCGLNEIACMNFPREDRIQLAQLIGYDLDSYGELSYVNEDKGEATTWEKLKEEFLLKIKELDNKTPWSETEPQWWLDMMEVASMLKKK